MSDTAVHDKLQGIFRAVFEDPTLEIRDTMTADDVDRWDSLTHITLIMDVEKAFGVRFRNAEVARLQNVGDLKALIAKHASPVTTAPWTALSRARSADLRASS